MADSTKTRAELLKEVAALRRQVSARARAPGAAASAESPGEQAAAGYRLLLESIPLKVFLKNTASVYVWCNSQYAADFGLQPEAIVGKTDRDLYPPDLAEKHRADDARVLAQGVAATFEESYEHDGRPCVWEKTKAPVRDETGTITGLLGMFQDITAKKAQEQAQAAERARLVTILEKTPDFVAFSELDGRVTYVNQAFRQVLGLTPEQSLQGFSIPQAHPPWAAARVITEAIPLAMRDGTWVGETVVLAADQHEIPVSQVIIAHRVAGGAVDFLSTIMRDITGQKRAEEIIRQQSQEILDVSVPVMRVWEGVIVAPLIGTLDSNRTQLFMERLLNEIVASGSTVALVDITGVPAIDTQTAQHLLETITAVRLLGADVILTGVRPAIAQTIVHLGVDLSGITTRPSLAAGLKVALQTTGKTVVAQKTVK